MIYQELDTMVDNNAPLNLNAYIQSFFVDPKTLTTELPLYKEKIVHEGLNLGIKEANAIARIVEHALYLVSKPNRMDEQGLVEKLKQVIDEIEGNSYDLADSEKKNTKKLFFGFIPVKEKKQSLDVDPLLAAGKQERAAKSIEALYIEIKRFHHMMMEDQQGIAKMENELRIHHQRLLILISAYKSILEERQAEADAAPNLEIKLQYQTDLTRLENKIQSLSLSCSSAQTILPQIYQMQQSNGVLLKACFNSFMVTLPILKDCILKESIRIKQEAMLKSQLLLQKSNAEHLQNNIHALEKSTVSNENMDQLKNCLTRLNEGIDVLERESGQR